jgi:glycolate oxidase FAD binding subunit
MATPTCADGRVRKLDRTRTLRPTTTEELRHALLDTAASHHRLTVRGSGTADTWAGRSSAADVTVDTTAMNGILQYNPADMTVAVRAGTTLASLQAEVGEHSQRVAFDPARAEQGATIGGLLTTADGGPSRHSYGTLRELVIGVTVVLADGTVARSGGHVIKNVAGYDLGKLFYGSFGTLGVLSEVVLRLHPTPRATSTVEIDVPVSEAYSLAHSIVSAGLEPAALELTGIQQDGAEGRQGTVGLLLRFEGTQTGVSERADAATALTSHPSRTLDADRAQATWSELAKHAIGDQGDTVIRVGSLPSDGARLVEWIASTAAARGMEATSASTLMRGVHTVRLRGGGSSVHDELLRAVHDAVGSACTVLRSDGLGPDTPLWGSPPRAVALMRAIKQQFDPHSRFDTGRLEPWLTPQTTGTE